MSSIAPSFILERVRFLADKHRWTLREVDPFAHSLIHLTLEAGAAQVIVGSGSLPAYPSNSAIAVSLARDKAYSLAVLDHFGLKVPTGFPVFLTENFRDCRPAGRELKDAVCLGDKIGFPVVVKPNNGSMGRDISLAKTSGDIYHSLQRLKHKGYDMALLQNYVKGEEWRLFIQSGVPCFAYRKNILDDRDGFKAKYSDGLPVRNLHRGAEISDFRTDFTASEVAFSGKIAQITGLDTLGVDLIDASNSPRTLAPYKPEPVFQEEMIILEVNGNPALKSLQLLDHIDLADEIIKRSIEKAASGSSIIRTVGFEPPDCGDK